ncbi:MAG TPA: hypothetical protein V6C90_11960 [Coleofasciculaceae cyanobacterium]|jgi:hypothetical protein
MNTVESTWDASSKLLVTHLIGNVSVDDVRLWKESLNRELDRIFDNTNFKLIVNLYGYEPLSIFVHKEMRSIIPLMLAGYALRSALLDWFAPVDLPIVKTRGISCIAVAHIHHDLHKMHGYDKKLGRANQRFFTDYTKAAEWIYAIG